MLAVAMLDYWIEGQDDSSWDERICRARKALTIAKAAQKKGEIVTIILCGGTPWKKNRSSLPPLAKTMKSWFMKQGWPGVSICIDPVGFDTITEIAVVEYNIVVYEKLIVVTSWQHMVRTWLIWAIAFRRFVWISPSTSALPLGKALWHECFSMLPALALAFFWGIGFRRWVRSKIEARFKPA